MNSLISVELSEVIIPTTPTIYPTISYSCYNIQPKYFGPRSQNRNQSPFVDRSHHDASGGLPVAVRQQAKKKNIDNRYDYTLHATQDDKRHDNARTN